MKRILVFLFVMFIFMPSVSAKDKAVIYIFTGEDCKVCNEAIKYLYDNQSTFADYAEVVTYEVWNNEANNELYNALKENIFLDVRLIPYIIIDENFYLNGYDTRDGKLIINEAKRAYEEGYNDPVAPLLSSNKEVEPKTMKEALIREGIIKDEQSNDLYLFIGIFVVIIGGLLLLSKNLKR